MVPKTVSKLVLTTAAKKQVLHFIPGIKAAHKKGQINSDYKSQLNVLLHKNSKSYFTRW